MGRRGVPLTGLRISFAISLKSSRVVLLALVLLIVHDWVFCWSIDGVGGSWDGMEFL